MREVRIVAPSMSLKEEKRKKIKSIEAYFCSLGYSLTMGNHIFLQDDLFGCSSIQERVEDLMNAFLDKNVEVIICADGGYQVNQILPYLDYDKIKQNPKIIIGYSDITALLIAIMKQCHFVTYYGPMLDGFYSLNEYTLSYFEKILKKDKFVLTSSKEIFDYQKKGSQSKKIVLSNKGMVAIQNGCACGRIIGGNLCTLNLLQGTKYMPNLDNCILFLEDDADDFGRDVFLFEFDRNLESLLQLPHCSIKGIVFGRFQLCSKMTIDKLMKVIQNKEKLKNIPIVAEADFGHTNPMVTIPLGGYCELSVQNQDIHIEIRFKK